jgi:hypothetical protein
MALKLKVGDRVLLKESSIFVDGSDDNFANGYNPLGVVGTIESIDDDGYDVLWNNGMDNFYDDDDIELYVETFVETIKPKRRRLLI